jgi:hypothetical protein
MKPNTAHQEVLLHTDSHFALGQLANLDENGPANQCAKERLEKACWDGLLKQLIPELDMMLKADHKLWLWQIHETRCFLALDFSESPGPKEIAASIDPYLFMGEIENN